MFFVSYSAITLIYILYYCSKLTSETLEKYVNSVLRHLNDVNDFKEL